MPEQLLDALPGRAGLRLLAVDADCPPRLPADAVRAAITVGSRSAGLVVVDLGAADPVLCTAVLPLAQLVCVVVGPHSRMVAAARRRLGSLPVPSGRSVLVVRGPAPGAMAPAGVGRSLQLPVFGVLGPEPGLDRDYARGAPPGRPRGPLARLCAALLAGMELPTTNPRSAAA